MSSSLAAPEIDASVLHFALISAITVADRFLIFGIPGGHDLAMAAQHELYDSHISADAYEHAMQSLAGRLQGCSWHACRTQSCVIQPAATIQEKVV